MDANRKRIMEMSVGRTIEALRKNNMEAAFLPSKADIVPMVKSLLAEHSTVGVGGSMTLFESGVIDLLRSGSYTFLDRYAKDLSPQQIDAVYHQCFDADSFLCSANAITEHGELYCVDGNSNRVAAMLYGPRQVIVIAGWNKIVADLAAAVVRVKQVATPANCIRLDCDTNCEKTGKCLNPTCDPRNLMQVAPGACQNTICCNSVIFGRQRRPGRITVLIVGEELGY